MLQNEIPKKVYPNEQIAVYKFGGIKPVAVVARVIEDVDENYFRGVLLLFENNNWWYSKLANLFPKECCRRIPCLDCCVGGGLAISIGHCNGYCGRCHSFRPEEPEGSEYRICDDMVKMFPLNILEMGTYLDPLGTYLHGRCNTSWEEVRPFVAKRQEQWLGRSYDTF